MIDERKKSNRERETSLPILSSGSCILMFSGGRDSSIAALRLVKRYSKVILVTVTSEHLLGIDTVYRRLAEIRRFMPDSAEWCCVKQPSTLLTDITFYAPTCLPCHHSYVVVGSLLAEQNGARNIAFGYAGYQASWPEQTSYAINRLKGLLAEFGFDLILPVYEINNIDDIKSELVEYGLSIIALEQKCSRQVTNIELKSDILCKEIDQWINSIRITLRLRHKLTLDVTNRIKIRDLS
jgi:hypothetical protein